VIQKIEQIETLSKLDHLTVPYTGVKSAHIDLFSFLRVTVSGLYRHKWTYRSNTENRYIFAPDFGDSTDFSNSWKFYDVIVSPICVSVFFL